MKPRISLVTLGADDLDKAVAFYRDGLGFQTEGIAAAGAQIVKAAAKTFWGGYVLRPRDVIGTS